MNAEIDLHFSPWGGFRSSPSMACKGLTQFLQSPECLEADPRNPGNRHADPAGSGSRGLAVYNAPRFNCDPLRNRANLKAIRLVHSAASQACRVRFRHR
jgi:hypothetical protein